MRKLRRTFFARLSVFAWKRAWELGPDRDYINWQGVGDFGEKMFWRYLKEEVPQ